MIRAERAALALGGGCRLGADRSRVVSKSLEMPDIARKLWVSLDACQLEATDSGREREEEQGGEEKEASVLPDPV